MYQLILLYTAFRKKQVPERDFFAAAGALTPSGVGRIRGPHGLPCQNYLTAAVP